MEYKPPRTGNPPNFFVNFWDTNYQKPVTHQANLVIQQQSITVLIVFYEGCALPPDKSLCIKSNKNEKFITWPGIAVAHMAKFYPVTTATPKGYLDQEQQNI